MSQVMGERTADPCPRCSVEAVRRGSPTSAGGREVVGYTCDRCAHTWSRPVETDVDVYDIVRVDLPDVTLYGTVWQVRTDRIQVRGTSGAGGAWLRWVERWRVIIY
ncbi:hypothetical protein ACFW9L_32905 [Streptomyces sp. NPDC059517]|uniref:hypothetical protein n=1 Tax=Streptomyces sp. NPDC059517 TaxID=3346855 RepID=UPI00368F5CC5